MNNFASTISSIIGLPYHDEILGSDEITTLNINYRWRRLIGNALQNHFDWYANQLTETDYDDAKERIQLLIHDLYTPDVIDMGYQIVELRRTSDLAILAGTTVITWQIGSNFDGGNPTRLIMPIEGRAIITAHIQITAGAVRSLVAQIIKNGGEVVGHYNAAADVTNQRLTLTTQDSIFIGDYYEISISTNAGSNFPASFEPQFFATIIPNP